MSGIYSIRFRYSVKLLPVVKTFALFMWILLSLKHYSDLYWRGSAGSGSCAPFLFFNAHIPFPYLKYIGACEQTSASLSSLCSDSSILPPRSSVQTLLRRWRWQTFPAWNEQRQREDNEINMAEMFCYIIESYWRFLFLFVPFHCGLLHYTVCIYLFNLSPCFRPF